MALLDELKLLGLDIDEALTRFMNNRELLERMLKKAPTAIAENSGIIADIDHGNIENAVLKAHTLKGNMGNLSITPLFEAYKEVTDLLRAGKADEARNKMQEIIPVQQKIIDVINNYNQNENQT